jgi:8-amino-7-oxononanoate synthase
MPGHDDSHIIAVVIGDPELTLRTGLRLLERGFLVGIIRPPTVPTGTSRLRVTVSAAHTDAQIDAFVSVLAETLPGSERFSRGAGRGVQHVR